MAQRAHDNCEVNFNLKRKYCTWGTFWFYHTDILIKKTLLRMTTFSLKVKTFFVSRSHDIQEYMGPFILQPLFQKSVEKWFQKSGSANSDLFFWSTTFLEPDFSNQISRTTFPEPLFYTFLEKWLQIKWSSEYTKISLTNKNNKAVHCTIIRPNNNKATKGQ